MKRRWVPVSGVLWLAMRWVWGAALAGSRSRIRTLPWASAAPTSQFPARGRLQTHCGIRGVSGTGRCGQRCLRPGCVAVHRPAPPRLCARLCFGAAGTHQGPCVRAMCWGGRAGPLAMGDTEGLSCCLFCAARLLLPPGHRQAFCGASTVARGLEVSGDAIGGRFQISVPGWGSRARGKNRARKTRVGNYVCRLVRPLNCLQGHPKTAA